MRKLRIAFFGGLVAMSLFACINKGTTDDSPYFLSELRPDYFNQLNFNDADTLAELPTYLLDFTNTYNGLEVAYQEGEYEFETDLENMSLANFYYSSLLSAIAKAYLDDMISFEDIIGDRAAGIFTDVPKTDSDFERAEMEAMAWRAVEVANLGLELKGKYDKSESAYVSARHVYAHLTDPYKKINPEQQSRVVSYSQEEIESFEFTSIWNLLKGLVLFDDYEEGENTFDNPEFDPLLENVLDRIDPVTLPNLNNSYTSLLSAIYLMDLVMKKVDWLYQQEELSKKDIRDIRGYINNMKIAELIIVRDRTDLLNSWEFKSSFKERQDKLRAIETHLEDFKDDENAPKPLLAPFFKTKNFRQAYQCYSCHKEPNL